MADEKWLKVREIFDNALKQKIEEREKYINEICGEDKTLLDEVNSLFSSLGKAENFMEESAVTFVADIMAGDKENSAEGKCFGHYEIVRQIGLGGMGEVYLACDKKLSRQVAIKILNEKLSRHESNLKRFIQEAKAASALNHPNILVIHEIGEVADTHFIVSEYIEGKTLRELISESPLKITEVLNISIQLANALSAAHQSHIIHRDIKPENIMVRPDGYVKILDFGLAKLIMPKAVGFKESTLNQNETAKGIILGTVNYMSPEQAKGEKVDEQTDIFSFGAVIYEMLVRQPPFADESMLETFANLIKQEPRPLADFTTNIPAELQSIVSKTLKKNKDERYQSMKDLLADLKNLQENPVFDKKMENTAASQNKVTQILQETTDNIINGAIETFSSSSPPIKRRQRLVALALMTITTIVVTGAYWFLFKASQHEKTPIIKQTLQLTNWEGLDFYPSISSDGNMIAFSSDRTGSFEIYIKQLVEGAKEVQITFDGMQNFQPAISPDSRFIAYSSRRGGIWIVPVTGGTPRQLTEFGTYPAWSPDGLTIAFSNSSNYVINPNGRNAIPPWTLWKVSLQGSEPQRLTQPGNPAGGHAAPAWSPDGKRIVFDVNDPTYSQIWSVSTEGDDLKELSDFPLATDAVYAPDGKSVFFVSQAGRYLWQLSLSAVGDPVGEPVRIVDAGNSHIRNLSISAKTGCLAYSTMTLISNLWEMSVSPNGNVIKGDPIHLTQSTNTRNVHPAFSPDGALIAYSSIDLLNSSQIFVMDADGKNKTQLTTIGDNNFVPIWFPDSKQISYQSGQSVSTVTVEGAKIKKLFDLPPPHLVKMSPDGKQFAYTSTDKDGITNIWLISPEGDEPKQLTFEDHANFLSWSPDGKWMAIGKRDHDENEIAIIPSSGGTSVKLLSDKNPTFFWGWSPDSDKILFAGLRDTVWNIYWISRSTKQQKQLTNFTKLNSYVVYPDWSPLGNKIVYEYGVTTGNIYMLEFK